MKNNRHKLSPKQSEILMYFAANHRLSIDQIAWAKSYSPRLLSKLVNSGKGRLFLEGLRQLPSTLLDSYILVANELPELIPLVPTHPRKLK